MSHPRLRVLVLAPVVLAILALASYAMFQEGAWPLAMVFAVLALLLVCLAALVVLPVGLAWTWLSTGHRPITAAGPLVPLGIFVVLAVPVLVRLLRGGYRLGGLELTPERVTYTSFARAHSLAWDDVDDIAVRPADGRIELAAWVLPTVRGPRVLAGERSADDSSVLAVPSRLLRVDTEALRALLEHYWRHPRERHELADGTALERSFASDAGERSR